MSVFSHITNRNLQYKLMLGECDLSTALRFRNAVHGEVTQSTTKRNHCHVFRK